MTSELLPMYRFIIFQGLKGPAIAGLPFQPGQQHPVAIRKLRFWEAPAALRYRHCMCYVRLAGPIWFSRAFLNSVRLQAVIARFHFRIDADGDNSLAKKIAFDI